MRRKYPYAAALVALVALCVVTPASAYTYEEQAACIGDAFQFCGYAIPDEGRVKACLIANVQRLSTGCRSLFHVPGPARGRRAATPVAQVPVGK
jgi:hypothetical protein